MESEHRYCARCGKAAHAGQYQWSALPLTRGRLERDMYDKTIAGVCSGMAKWLGWDVTVMRLLWLGSRCLPASASSPIQSSGW